MQIKNLLLYLKVILLASVVVLIQSNVYSQQGINHKPQRVLYISSYHPSFPSFSQQVNGLKSIFADENIFFDIEFMDTKRFPDDTNWDNFLSQLSYKIENAEVYDVVIVADDNALMFAIENQKSLFSGIPIVFLGVNYIHLALEQNDNPMITGVVESVSMYETIELMIKLRPYAKNIIAIVDGTPSGQGDLETFYEVRENFRSHKFSEISLTSTDWRGFWDSLESLDNSSAVLLLSAYKDTTNKTFTFDDSFRQIKEHLKEPVFHLWYHGLGEGVIGGKIISHFEQGITAANIVLDILHGENISDIPVISSSPNRYVFDYIELGKYKISESDLPDDSVVLNKPYSFYDENKTLLWSVVSVIISLSFLLFLAIINIIKREKIERKLQENKALLLRSQEIAHVGSWELDITTNHLTWSDEVYRIFGCEPQSFAATYEALLDLVHPDDQIKVDDAYSDSLQDAASGYEIEHRIVRPGSAEIRWVYERCVHERSDDGTLLRSIGMVQDITERKQAEEALRKSEAIKNTMVSNIGDVIVIIDQNGINKYKSPNITKLFGWSPEELVGKSAWDNVHPDDLEASQKFLGRIATEPNATGTTELRYKRKDGKYVWIEINVINLLYDKDIEGVLGNYQDITKRKQQEEALKESEELSRKLIATVPDIIVRTDINGKVLFYNEALIKNYPALEHEKILDKNMLSFFSKEDKLRAEKNTKLMFEKPLGVKEYELQIANNNYNFEINGEVLRDASSNPTGMVYILRDITERKKAEELLARSSKLESIGTLAGGIAHDFNNLLSGIFGNIDIARHINDNKKINGYLEKTFESIERAKSLTSQLLTFAKGGEPIKKIENMLPFIKETVEFALSGSNIKCQFTLQKDLWLSDIDKHQIGQVIDNIVINALHAMPECGKLKVTAENIDKSDVSTIKQLEINNYVKITIEDTGIGIPQNYIGKIFDPFYTTKTKGHGIGLSTAFSIINKHKGTIEVESEVGKGTTFYIYLPASEKSEKVLPKELEEDHEGTGIFVVMDDDEAVRANLSEMLELCGYDTNSFSNGEEVIEFVKSELKAGRDIKGMIFDLTIQGGMGGKETIEEIRKLTKDVPVFVASGYADDPIMSNPIEYGFTDSLVKPYSLDNLNKLLNKHLG